jgi:hypothetical protein
MQGIRQDIRALRERMGESSDDDELPHLYVRMMEHSDAPQGKRPTFTPNIATVEGKQVKFIVPLPNEVQDLMRHFLPLISEQMRGTDVFGAVEEMSRGTGTVRDPLKTQWNGSDLKGVMVKAHTLTSTDGTPFGVFVLLQNGKQGASYRVCVVSPSADFRPNQLSSAWESYCSDVALSQKQRLQPWVPSKCLQYRAVPRVAASCPRRTSQLIQVMAQQSHPSARYWREVMQQALEREDKGILEFGVRRIG